MKQLRKVIALILFISIAFLALQFILYRGIYPYSYGTIVDKASEEFHLDPYLILSVIKAESKFDREALSNKGAVGLMQVTLPTGEELALDLGVENFSQETLYREDINIRLGSYYLSKLTSEFPVVETALAAYNAGPGNVKKWLKEESYSHDGYHLHSIPFPETEEYVRKIRANYNSYRLLYESIPKWIPEKLLIFMKK